MLPFVMIGLGRISGPLSEGSARLLSLVREDPGVRVGKLQARSGWGAFTFYLHLRDLKSRKRVKIKSSGRQRFVFPISKGAPIPHRVKAEFKASAASRRVARFIQEHPGVRIDDIVRGLAVSPRAAYHHVQNLVAQGLITSASPTRYESLRGTGKLHEFLDDSS